MKYKMKMRLGRGLSGEAIQDSVLMQVGNKSLNLLDFERNREKDLFLCDISSDRTEFGGYSETELSIMQEETSGETYLNI